jgi:hypothetical protein
MLLASDTSIPSSTTCAIRIPSQPWDEGPHRNGQASQAGGVGPLASIAKSLPHEYRGRLWITSPMNC